MALKSSSTNLGWFIGELLIGKEPKIAEIRTFRATFSRWKETDVVSVEVSTGGFDMTEPVFIKCDLENIKNIVSYKKYPNTTEKLLRF